MFLATSLFSTCPPVISSPWVWRRDSPLNSTPKLLPQPHRQGAEKERPIWKFVQVFVIIYD